MKLIDLKDERILPAVCERRKIDGHGVGKMIRKEARDGSKSAQKCSETRIADSVGRLKGGLQDSELVLVFRSLFNRCSDVRTGRFPRGGSSMKDECVNSRV